MIFRHLLLVLAVLLFLPSQVFWFWQLRALGRKFIPNLSVRRWLAGLGMGFYLLAMAFSWLPRPAPEPAHLTLRAALLEAPFRWWVLSSLLGFVLIAAFYLCNYLGRAVFRLYRKFLPAPAVRIPAPFTAAKVSSKPGTPQSST